MAGAISIPRNVRSAYIYLRVESDNIRCIHYENMHAHAIYRKYFGCKKMKIFTGKIWIFFLFLLKT